MHTSTCSPHNALVRLNGGPGRAKEVAEWGSEWTLWVEWVESGESGEDWLFLQLCRIRHFLWPYYSNIPTSYPDFISWFQVISNPLHPWRSLWHNNPNFIMKACTFLSPLAATMTIILPRTAATMAIIPSSDSSDGHFMFSAVPRYLTSSSLPLSQVYSYCRQYDWYIFIPAEICQPVWKILCRGGFTCNGLTKNPPFIAGTCKKA